MFDPSYRSRAVQAACGGVGLISHIVYVLLPRFSVPLFLLACPLLIVHSPVASILLFSDLECKFLFLVCPFWFLSLLPSSRSSSSSLPFRLPQSAISTSPSRSSGDTSLVSFSRKPRGSVLWENSRVSRSRRRGPSFSLPLVEPPKLILRLLRLPLLDFLRGFSPTSGRRSPRPLDETNGRGVGRRVRLHSFSILSFPCLRLTFPPS